MKDLHCKKLSEKQQQLLSRYVDNACSFFARFRAELLLKNNRAAQLFVDSLGRTSQAVRSSALTQDLSVDLWDRISNRIDAEERAALYLGQRKPEVEESRSFGLGALLSRHALLGGFSGATLAAIALVALYRPVKPGEIVPVYSGNSMAAHNSSPLHQASYGGAPRVSGPKSTMNFDWMRANGSFSVIQNPNDKSGIIWVRKRNPAGAFKKQNLNPTPTIRILEEEGLDDSPLNTPK